MEDFRDKTAGCNMSPFEPWRTGFNSKTFSNIIGKNGKGLQKIKLIVTWLGAFNGASFLNVML